MSSAVRHVTFDAGDPYALAVFWAAVLGGRLGDGDRPGDPEVAVVGQGTELLFVAVPHEKAGKNRVHLDLAPQDRGRDAEVDRLLALGAAQVDDRRNPDGTGWVVLADPEGNEFCVERGDAERHPGAAPRAQVPPRRAPGPGRWPGHPEA